MLASGVAQAEVLITRPEFSKLAINLQEAKVQSMRNVRLLESIIRATGGTYQTIYQNDYKTEWGRTGRQYVGTSYKQYDAVIHIGSLNPVPGSTGGFRPDSLFFTRVQGGSTRTDKAVPFLLMLDNSGPITGTGVVPDAVADSAGVIELPNGPAPAYNFGGDTRAAATHIYTQGYVGAFDTGDMRKILYARTFPYIWRASTSDDGVTIPCSWCDSLSSYAANDTLLLWDRQFNTRLGQASTVTVASVGGAGAAADSLANNSIPAAHRPGTESDLTLMLASLAHLDSLVRAKRDSTGRYLGERVLGDKVIKIAPVIYGGLANGQRHAWKSPGSAQGRSPSDTASFYAALDSLNALGIPVTFAVNVDSASYFARDVIKMKSVRSARFTPQIWNNVADTSSFKVQNALYEPKDVFGRWRKRIAIGDGSGLGADTLAIYTLARSALRLTDSLFDGRTSRFAVAPDDDWSPLNITGRDPGGLGIDSVMYALQRAGYIGVVADAQDPDAKAFKSHGPSKTNPRGYYGQQMRYSSPTISALRDFRILAHSGYNIMGGRAQYMFGPDSTQSVSAFGVDGSGILFRELTRSWSGALLDFDNAYDIFQYDERWPNDRAYDNIHQRKVDRTESPNNGPVRKASIVRLSCADFSGKPGANPMMGYWILKSMANAMYIINTLAGRTIVRFAYPEDIEP